MLKFIESGKSEKLTTYVIVLIISVTYSRIEFGKVPTIEIWKSVLTFKNKDLLNIYMFNSVFFEYIGNFPLSTEHMMCNNFIPRMNISIDEFMRN